MTINNDTEDTPKPILHRDIVNKSLAYKPCNKQELKEIVLNGIKKGITDFNNIDLSLITDLS